DQQAIPEQFSTATTGEKEKHSTKFDAMEVSTAEPVTTAGEVVTTASEAVSTTGVQDSAGPTIPVTIAATTLQISKDELTLTQTLMEIKAAKPKVVTTVTTTVSTESKAKGVSIQEPSETTTRVVITPSKVKARDKGKAIMVKPEIPLKKKKVDEQVEDEKDDDQEEMKKHMEIVVKEEISIDAIPLATKPPVIVEYKLIREGIMGHYQLIRAYGSFKRYSSMIRMLQGIDREDLQTLWKLVKTKHGDIRPEDEHERVL
ncbi:hypothetical protein Tco_1196087, partial [Tanacetum coccineum]